LANFGQAVEGSARVFWVWLFFHQLELAHAFEALRQYGAADVQNFKKLVVPVKTQCHGRDQKYRPSVINDGKNIALGLPFVIGIGHSPSVVANGAGRVGQGLAS